MLFPVVSLKHKKYYLLFMFHLLQPLSCSLNKISIYFPVKISINRLNLILSGTKTSFEKTTKIIFKLANIFLQKDEFQWMYPR
jgi:hypothetical protein